MLVIDQVDSTLMMFRHAEAYLGYAVMYEFYRIGEDIKVVDYVNVSLIKLTSRSLTGIEFGRAKILVLVGFLTHPVSNLRVLKATPKSTYPITISK